MTRLLSLVPALVLVLATALAIVACGGGPQCAIDTDCPLGQRCASDGTCQPVGVAMDSGAEPTDAGARDGAVRDGAPSDSGRGDGGGGDAGGSDGGDDAGGLDAGEDAGLAP